jgi:O-antigen/teichoic acid export membrane protein
VIEKIKIKFFSFFSEGHSRTLLAKKNIAISFLIKGGSIIIGLILVPMTINYVTPKEYGIWLTLSSIISWLSFFDIGLGNGLKNKLAETNALQQNEKSKIYISTTYAILSVISLLLFLMFLFINRFLKWEVILNSPNYKGESLGTVAIAVVGLFCISFVIQSINTILMANHKTALSSLISLVGSFLSLICIFLLTKFASTSLLKLVIALGGIPIIVQMGATIWLFRTSLKKIRPKLNSVDFTYAKSLLSIGGVFFVIQIGALVLFQTDNIVITQLFGTEEVTIFNIAYKLFSVIIMAFSIILAPFWSAFTDANVKNDMSWIKNIITKMQKYWLLLILLTIFVLVLSPIIFKLWLGSNIKIPFSLSLSMAFYVIAYAWQTIHVFLLNGIGKIRLQLYLVICSAIINIPLAIFLGNRIGLAGITLSNAILFTFMGVIFSVQCKKILNNTATGIWQK